MKPAAAAALAASALLVGLATPAVAAPARTAPATTATTTTATTTTTPTAPTVVVSRVSGVVDYHLDQRLPSGQQLDSGSATISYTCTNPAPGRATALALADVGFAAGARFGQPLTCDGRRHTEALTLSRGSGSPVTPPAPRGQADLRVTVVWMCQTDCTTALPDPVSVSTPVRVVFTGF